MFWLRRLIEETRAHKMPDATAEPFRNPRPADLIPARLVDSLERRTQLRTVLTNRVSALGN